MRELKMALNSWFSCLFLQKAMSPGVSLVPSFCLLFLFMDLTLISQQLLWWAMWWPTGRLCPVSGHHGLGTWTYLEMGVFAVVIEQENFRWNLLAYPDRPYIWVQKAPWENRQSWKQGSNSQGTAGKVRVAERGKGRYPSVSRERGPANTSVSDFRPQGLESTNFYCSKLKNLFQFVPVALGN